MQSGIYKGERYDAVQVNIRYNHVAGVDLGRAGPEVRLRVDSSDNQQEKTMGDENKTSVEVNGVHYDLNPAAAQAVAHIKKELAEAKADSVTFQEGYDAMKAERDTLSKDKEKMQGTIDTLTEELDAFKAKEKGDEDEEEMDEDEEEVKGGEKKGDSIDPAVLQAAVQKRIELLQIAHAINFDAKDAEGEAIKLDAMTNADIQRAIVAHRYPNLKLDELDDGYVQGRFDGIAAVVDIDEKTKLDGLKKLGGMFSSPAPVDPTKMDQGDFSSTMKSATDEYLKNMSTADVD